MGKKRGLHWRDDSSSSSTSDSSCSDAKRRRSRHYHVGDTSRANDGTPREDILGVFRDAVIEFKDAIQVKAKTNRKINKLKENGKKYKEELRILKEGQEDLRKFKEELRILKEGHEDLKILKNDHRILKEEQRILKEELRILKEGHEDHTTKIQELQKEGCAEVDHYRASPSQRSQPSKSPRYNLRIETIVSSTIFKRETVTTKDGSGCIKVAMYDGVLPIACNHPLASVRVDLVVIKGSFNKGKKASWSREEFKENIIKPRDDNCLVKNDTFYLNDGSCHHEGAIIMDNSQQKEVKLGVMVTVPTKERVLEGVSNPFKVQESKTKVSRKKDKKLPPSVTPPNMVQPTSTHATQHGQGAVSPDEQHSLSPPVLQKVPQKQALLPQNFQDYGKNTGFPTDDTEEDNALSYPTATVPQMVEGNGQAQNGNGQNFSHGEQMLGQSTSTNPMQHGKSYYDCGKSTEFLTDNTGESTGLSCTPGTVPQMVEGNGQASCLGPPLSCCPPLPSIQNPLQAAGYCPVNQPLFSFGEDHYTSFPNANYQLALPNPYEPLNNIQWESFLEDGTSVQTQIQETYEKFRCGRVLLQWDNPHVELKEHWNFLDQLMPLYSTKSRFYTESFPGTSLMDKAHKLLASISSGNSVSKMITSGMSQVSLTPERRGVLIRPIGPDDSDDEPPVKKPRNAKYQLRFVNRVCNIYYTNEQIKSEDGTFLRVALYDENNLVVTSGPLSSARVEVLLFHGDFNADDQDMEEFIALPDMDGYSSNIEDYLPTPPAMRGDFVLALTDGEADLGNVNFHTTSFYARTGKFKMGVTMREESVQKGITCPFLVRVRVGGEATRDRTLIEDHHHRMTSPNALHRAGIFLLDCMSPEHDAKENVCTSSALHDQSSQVKVLGTLTASARSPERDLGWDLSSTSLR